jgi:hypothetical protein
MTLIKLGSDNVPNFIALSSDITIDDKIVGASIIGGTVYLTDTSAWKIIKSDLTLDDYFLPITLSGSVSLGTVSQGAGGNSAWKTDSSATTQPVSGTFWQATQPVSGPITDIQIRATPLPVSGTITANTGLSQPLTDTQLRVSPVSISGTVISTPSGTQTISGNVTANAGTNLNTSTLALESGGNLASIKAKTDNIPVLGQALAALSVPVVLTASQLSTLTPPATITGFATETTLSNRLSESDFDTKIGSLTEIVPNTDTASSGLNGRLQKVAQNITNLISKFPSSLGSNGGLKIEGVSGGTPIPISGTITTTLSNGVLVSPTITISATPDYSVADCIGGIITLSNVISVANGVSKFDSLSISDKSGTAPQFSMYFFKDTPTGGTYTDNLPIVWGANDASNFLGRINVGALDYKTISGVSFATLLVIGQLQTSVNTNVYVIISADSPYNANSTSDLTIRFGYEKM